MSAADGDTDDVEFALFKGMLAGEESSRATSSLAVEVAASCSEDAFLVAGMEDNERMALAALEARSVLNAWVARGGDHDEVERFFDDVIAFGWRVAGASGDRQLYRADDGREGIVVTSASPEEGGTIVYLAGRWGVDEDRAYAIGKRLGFAP